VTQRRQENATLLSERLSAIEGITVPAVGDDRNHVWHQYTIIVENEFGLSRDQLAEQLNQNGIGSGVYYPKTMIDHDTFRDHPKIIAEPTPVADEVSEKVLSLPIHPGVSFDDIDRIAETVAVIQRGVA
jgi:dTDP-4-amino-4,6-dideoxygalactose transaminase